MKKEQTNKTETTAATPKSTPPAKKTSKVVKAPKTPKAPKVEKPEEPPTLANHYNHSGTAVLRRLGKEGLTVAHVRAIVAANKWDLSDPTVSTQVNAGTHGLRGAPAELTQAQLKEIKASAEDPAKAEKE